MARKVDGNVKRDPVKKKTSIGNSHRTKHSHKKGKKYKKKYRGQGKRR